MTKKPGRRPGKSAASLSDDEHNLWTYTSASVDPLRKGKGRVLASADQAPESTRTRPTQPELPPPSPPAPAKPASAERAPVARRSPPPLSTIDQRKARGLRSGRIEIEARIDLHGMRQSEAHAALRGFLIASQGKGRRWVLVITGKGAPPRSSWADHEGEDTAFSSSDRRGVLRKQVPLWLDQPELRAMVVSFTTAAIQHGGEGALYVQLRVRRPRNA